MGSEKRATKNIDLNSLLEAIKRYNEKSNKSLYLTLYQDGSGYFGEECGLDSEIEFEFYNIRELLVRLNR